MITLPWTSHTRGKSTIICVVTMAFSILPCQAIVKEWPWCLTHSYQREYTSSLVFQTLQVCCRQINKPCLEEVSAFEAAQHIFFIRSAVRCMKQCIIMKYSKWYYGYAGTFSFKKKKSLDSVATVGWVCRWYCYHYSALFHWKRCLLAISLNEEKLQRSLLSHRTIYISIYMYIYSNKQTSIFIQELELSVCSNTYIDHFVGNKTIHL